MFGVSPPPTKMARLSQNSVQATPLRGGGGVGGVAPLPFGGASQSGAHRVGAGTAFNPHEVAKCEVGVAVTYVQDRQGIMKGWSTLSAPSLQPTLGGSLGKGSMMRPFAILNRGGRGAAAYGKSTGPAPFQGEGDNGSILMAGVDGEVRRVTSDAVISLDYFQKEGDEAINAVAFASAPSTISGSPSAVAAFATAAGSISVKADLGVAGAATEITANDLTDYLKSLYDAQQAALAGSDSSEDEAPANQGGGGWFGWLSGRKKAEPRKKNSKRKNTTTLVDGSSPASSAGGGLDDSNMSSINGGVSAGGVSPYLQFSEGGRFLFYAVDIHLFVFELPQSQEDDAESVVIRQYVDLSALGHGTQVLAITTAQIATTGGTQCYCLIGEVPSTGLDTMLDDNGHHQTDSSDSTLTVVQFSVAQGKLINQPVNLSIKRGYALHCGIHVLAGKVVVVAGNNMATVNFGGQGMRHPAGDEVRPLQETVYGSRVLDSQNKTPSLLLFNKHGFTLEAPHTFPTTVGASQLGLNNAASSAGGKVVSQIMAATQGARPSERPDDVALAASEDILSAIDQNPTNWARGNLDHEDRNLMNFVTTSLTRRTENHQELLLGIFGSAPVVQLLKPQTQANLVSAQEKLAALLTLRRLQNEDRVTTQIELRQDVLKHAVVTVGNLVQQQKGRTSNKNSNMTAAELAYSSTEHLGMLLYQVNESLQITGSSPCPLEEKVNKALACGEIWGAVLASLCDKQMAFRTSPQAAPFMWMTASDFGTELRRLAFMLSDVLSMLVTSKPEDAGEQTAAAFQTSGSESAGRCQQNVLNLLTLLKAALDTLLTFHPERQSISSDLIRRTLLRSPFFENEASGYPHGAPIASTIPAAGGASCLVILEAAEALALKHKGGPLHEILFEFACSDVHDHLADIGAQFDELNGDVNKRRGGYSAQQVHRLNAYLDSDPSLYPYMLGRLINQNREREVEVLPGFITTLRDAVGIRNNFISAHYPELHWLFEDFPLNSMLQDARDAGGHHTNPVVYGDDAVDHCINTLSLASLAWVASGRPREAKPRLENAKRVAKTQDYLLPELREKNLSEESIVAALLQKPESSCWVEATVVAHHTTDLQLRDRLLLSCLLHSAQSESAHFTEVLNDGAAGDNERKSKIDNSATAKVCRASAALLHKLISRDKALGEDMAQQRLGDVYALLTDWSKGEKISA